MNYPGKANNNYVKTINYKNRGMNFEDDLNLTNNYYLEINKAIIYKKHTIFYKNFLLGFISKNQSIPK